MISTTTQIPFNCGEFLDAIKSAISVNKTSNNTYSPSHGKVILRTSENDQLSLISLGDRMTFMRKFSGSFNEPVNIAMHGADIVNILQTFKTSDLLTFSLISEQNNEEGEYRLSVSNIMDADWAPSVMVTSAEDIQINSEEFEFSHEFNISNKTLKKFIEITSHAISGESHRHYLNGLYIHYAADVYAERTDDKLRMVATDGHRLAHMQIDAPNGVNSDMPGVIVPRKTIIELNRLIENYDVTVNVARNQISFEIGKILLSSEIIEETYADYARILPKHTDTMYVNTTDLHRAVKMVSIKKKGVLLTKTDSRMTVEDTQRSLSGTISLSNSEKGNDIKFAFNAQYLLDIIPRIKSKKLLIEYNGIDNMSPVILRDEYDDDYFYILMPMRY